MSPELPSGTVTFVFTDVEGSTALLGELGADVYAEALAGHRAVIREACVGNGGVEVDTQGDAFFFAFPTAPGALAAASELTGRLAANGPIRVRVGVHTGTPLMSEEGYVGQDVHRAARIAAAGHGGQVLVSASTASLVEIELTDLGEHRFKDLGAPERVFQLGEDEFPTLNSLHRTNLPAPATAFLGRERELAEVVGLLGDAAARLVTLTGPGGTGKTRLMLQAAAEVSDRFPDGVYWIPLAPLRDESALGETFAQAIGMRAQPGVEIGSAIVRAFEGRRSLLVVDNCEHLAAGVAELVRRLVDGCRLLVCVASSRERLGLRSERVYEVPPMEPADAVALFVSRASAVNPGFRPDEHVSAICEALEELPLAVELAAARVRALSTSAIRDRLTQRLGLLTSRDRDVEERQRTLEATIAWSYELLDDSERGVLRRLSVFAGGCTLAAAEAVAGADLDSLESLLDKSLIRHRSDERGRDRYWMLETIREYALRELERSGEAADAGARHAGYFAGLAGELVQPVGSSVSDEQRDLFVRERANFHQAHNRALATRDGATAVRFVRYLSRVTFALAAATGDWQAKQLASLALPGGTREDRAYALARTAGVASLLGEAAHARTLLDEADGLFDQLADEHGRVDALAVRFDVEVRAGNYDEAVALAERLEAIEAGQTPDPVNGPLAERMLAFALLARALEEDDRQAAERSQALLAARAARAAESGTLSVQAGVLVNLAWIHFVLKDYSESAAAGRRALAKLLEVEATLQIETPMVADPICAVGLAVCGSGDHRLGISLLSFARRRWRDDAIAEEAYAKAAFARIEKNARAALGDEGHDAAVRAGEALTRKQAIELALGTSTPD